MNVQILKEAGTGHRIAVRAEDVAYGIETAAGVSVCIQNPDRSIMRVTVTASLEEIAALMNGARGADWRT